MAHAQQVQFCSSTRDRLPQFFTGALVLDVGALDINGNNQYICDADCVYLAHDAGPGKNVDLITPAHNLDLSDSTEKGIFV
ncbi:MAG: hypothetical protein ACYCSS_03985 [Sulfuriferula sp.]